MASNRKTFEIYGYIEEITSLQKVNEKYAYRNVILSVPKAFNSFGDSDLMCLTLERNSKYNFLDLIASFNEGDFVRIDFQIRSKKSTKGYWYNSLVIINIEKSETI